MNVLTEAFRLAVERQAEAHIAGLLGNGSGPATPVGDGTLVDEG